MKRVLLFVFASTLVFACTETNTPVEVLDDQGPELMTAAAKPQPGPPHEYRIVPILTLYNQAEPYAESLTDGLGRTGHLATITSAEEEALIAALVLPPLDVCGGSYWFGLLQREKAHWADQKWYWITGERVGKYTNWGPGEPDDAWPGDDLEHGNANIAELHFYSGKTYWADTIVTENTKRCLIVEFE